MTIWHMRVACWKSKTTLAQAQSLPRAPTRKHAGTHNHAFTPELKRARDFTHSLTHTHTHTHTHTQKHVIFIARPRQQLFRERALMLYVHCLACLT